MTDVKKFWLTNVLYLLTFLLLPIIPIIRDNLFAYLNYIFNKINIDIESIIIYYFVFFPILIGFVYYLLIRKFKFRFKKSLFAIFFVVIPYVIIIIYLIYLFIMTISNFRGAGSW